MRKRSVVAPEWWDYTTISDDLVADVAKLTVRDLEQLSRPGFKVVMYDSIEEFYLAEALEYIEAWQQSTPDNPCGVCGPIGPTEQLPLVARIVNATGMNLGRLGAHFWGMDEWVENGVAVSMDHENGDRRTLRVTKYLGEVKNLSTPFPFVITPGRGIISEAEATPPPNPAPEKPGRPAPAAQTLPLDAPDPAPADAPPRASHRKPINFSSVIRFPE